MHPDLPQINGKKSRMPNAVGVSSWRRGFFLEAGFLPGGRAPQCIPVLFEHFGSWGNAAERLLNTLT